MKNYQPDYPRPQLARSNWENLNGYWQFAFDDQGVGLEQGWANGVPGTQKILVPFTYETKASGIGDESVHTRVWYSRTVQLSQLPAGRRTLLHLEGCDYHATVWVNGVRAGEHVGGYARFSLDITPWLHVGDNVLAVMAEDSLDPRQPRGKQRWKGENFGCWYVQTTGIWKTVWMESVPESYLSALKLTPNLAQASLALEAQVEAADYGQHLLLEAKVWHQGNFIASTTVAVTGKHVKAQLSVANVGEHEWSVHTWTPNNPQLYDLELHLKENGQEGDEVWSYFGMREIRIEGRNVLLNGSPLYQRLILDQGYWPDSHLTPPSEAALIEDIEKIQRLGYNGVRKHQKIEDERFLYWCDVKGLLVWSEMAAAYIFDDTAVADFMTQWTEIVRQNYNHPCIITWTPVNESWGVPQVKTSPAQQHFTQAIYHLTKSLDPMRPVIVNDGWEHTVSDIITLHDYEEKGSVLLERYEQYGQEILEGKVFHNLDRSAFAQGFQDRGQPVIISEFGGIAYNNGEAGWGYGNKVNTEEEFLARFADVTHAIQRLPYCCGYCYTQVTDVQQEINGLMDMQRNFKADPEKICQINKSQVSCLHR